MRVLFSFILCFVVCPLVFSLPSPYEEGAFHGPSKTWLASVFADPSAYDKAPVYNLTGKFPEYTRESFGRVINNQLVHGHVFTFHNNPVGTFHFSEPLNGCPGMIRTSVTAEARKCKVAMNAGFFDTMRGTCLGNLVTDGKIVQNTGTRNANFGFTKDGEYVVGYLSKSDVEKLDLYELIAGVLWLVRDGKVYVDESVREEAPAFDFVWIKAPRTAVGFDEEGKIMIFEVDGAEPSRSGLDLYEWAELVKSFGAVQAINLDGGGSTAVWERGKTINKPSDFCGGDAGIHCERAVTTICCYKS
jgi:N-acetylglucosamine-1-phosphodiester alpha-N-acetylglucosaminidase